MKPNNKLLILLICLCSYSVTSAATISWIGGLTGPDDWTIDPANPNESDIISFSGPTGLYANSCFAMGNLGGTPMISVDTTNKIVELYFQGPAPEQCVLIWQPVSGLEGDFGPLSPGNWTFKCTVPSIAFEISFTVSGATTSNVYYVDKDAPGPVNDGTSWNRAFKNLQDALAIAAPGDVVLMAAGTYRPDQGGSKIPGDRTASFEIGNGISIIGGYAGYGNPNPDARDVDTYITRLDGDLKNDDSWGTAYRNNNSYHVVKAAGSSSSSALLDGLYISSGQADGSYPENSGGGIYIEGINLMLINCTISSNTAGFGGGISCNSGSASILNSKIRANNSYIYGGGLYNYSGIIDLINCLIVGNSSYQAETAGGSAIHNLGGSLTITNCTIADNSTPDGKTITSYTWKSPADIYMTILNTILYDNGDEVHSNHDETITISYSNIRGGWSGPGVNNINSNPKFISHGTLSMEGELSIEEFIGGNYQLQSSSLCIDAGDNASLPEDFADLDIDGNTSEKLPLDIDGELRIQGGTVDMGAYETVPTTVPPEPDPSDPEPPDEDGIWVYVPTNPSSNYIYEGSTSASFYINFQAILSLQVTPTSAAGGIWTAWFDPNPGIVGPGSVTVTVYVRGTNIDLTPLSPGYHKLADVTIYAQPIGP